MSDRTTQTSFASGSQDGIESDQFAPHLSSSTRDVPGLREVQLWLTDISRTLLAFRPASPPADDPVEPVIRP